MRAFLGAVLLGASALLHSAPSTADPAVRPEAPVGVTSPAWKTLMSEPLRDGDALAFGAADVLERWQKPEAASRLRRAMLLAQLQAAATPSALPPDSASVGSLWAASEPPPTLDRLQTALDAALQQGLRLSPRKEPPQAPGSWVPEPIPDMPGFWRLPQTAGVLVAMDLRNQAPLSLVLERAEADVFWSGSTQPLQLRCALLQPKPRLAPQAVASLQCAGSALPPGVRGPPERWHWRPEWLRSDAALKAMASALADPGSRRFQTLARQMDDCRAQGNCSDAQSDLQQQQAEAKAQGARERAAADQAERQAEVVRQARAERNKALMLVAAIVAGQFVFVGLARATGGVGLPSLLVLGAGGGIAFWIFRTTQQTHGDSLTLLVMGFVSLGFLAASLMLCAVYAAVYRRFFKEA